MGSAFSNKLSLLLLLFTLSSAAALATLLWLFFEYRGVRGSVPPWTIAAVVLALIILPVLLVAAVRLTNGTISRLAKKLERDELHLKEVQAIARMGSWVQDYEAGLLTWSEETYRVYGLSSQSFTPTTEAFYERVHPDDRDMVRQAMKHALATGERYAVDHRIVLPDSSVRHVAESAEVVRDPAGRPLRVVGTVQDITARVTQEQALLASNERYRKVLETVPIPILILQRGLIAYVNQSCCDLLAASAPDQIIGKTPDEIYHPASHDNVRERLRKVTEEHRPVAVSEERAIGLDGAIHTLDVIAAPFEDGGEPGVLTAWRDVTRSRRAEEQILHDALHDRLTSLPNRALFLDRVSRCLDLYKRRPENRFAVLFLDLDHFKLINDGLGHMVGDQLLILVAARLRQMLRAGHTLARPGGDEFAILIDHVTDVEDAQRTARQVLNEMSAPFKVEGQALFVTGSIGVAMCAPHYALPDEILRDADTAMFRAKSQGRARYATFDPSMFEAAVARLQLANDLRRALDAREFELLFQPVMNLGSGGIVGLEALMRWRHPTRGLLNPAHFIPLAEEAGSIVSLDRWALEEACRHALGWNSGRTGGNRISVSVNFSPRNFPQSDCASIVERVLADTGLDGSLLHIEITESALIENIESSIATIQSLNSLGVQVHLDDYGTGYSSLIHLSRLPVSHLKIDRSFVKLMETSPRDAGIVQSTVALAHGLGMRAIAEGVETGGQRDQLRAFGCEEAQGYLFYPPLEKSKIDEILLAA